MYDAIIVGARCAGSPLAMLLARKGYRILLLDRASFPSDTISTHHIHQPGVAHLKRWGLLEKLRASNCPPTKTIKFDVGPFALAGSPPPANGNAEAYAPRRRVLDKILVDAAVDAGAELRERFTVEELTTDGESITGIRGRDANGSTVTEHARIVIGADGARSMVANAVNAPVYFDRGMLTCNYYSYWSGVQHEGVELYPRDGRTIVVDKTNDGLSMICIVFPKEEFDRVRSNIEGEYLRTIQQNAPTLFERMKNGRREERFAGTGFLPNFFRQPYGNGWALVGDAGYVKDPILAQGITNSFSHAEMLAEALDQAFLGLREMEDALADYEYNRNDEVRAMFEHNCQLAMLKPPPPEMVTLLNALRGNPVEIGRFLGTVAGTVSLTEFFSPENVGRIIDRSALRRAA
ncbi:MAG TPA: NAD(P)/FAD-dependent oxidoreductase [Pyrinomonadaceae bacterium]|nr:NAD(P)/FAD-dependent oxidoreductase [Pyrinomonadaceae bacterium]